MENEVNKFKVSIKRIYEYETEVEAETQEEALNKVNEEIDGFLLHGNELYIHEEEAELVEE